MQKQVLQSFFLSSCISMTLLLAGCSVTPETPKTPKPVAQAPQMSTARPIQQGEKPAIPAQPETVKPTITQANQLMKKGRHAQAAEMYYRSAFNHPGPQRERIILQAAEITASLGDKKKTRSYLKAASQQTQQPANRIRYSYIQSLLALHDQQADRALNLLPRQTRHLPKTLRDKIELVRQRAIKMGGRYTPSPNQTQQHPVQNQTSQPPHHNPSPAIRQSGQQTSPAQAANQSAQQPANPGFTLPQSANKIAVLLPQQGALGKVGDEIYQGMQTAQARYGSNTLSKRYAVNKNNALEQYQQAIADGADIVVGPLDKGSLATLMTQPQALQIPILSLNYLSGTNNVPPTLYQFGLAPEDEARQIAEFAIQRQQRNGVIMAPDSAWGKRLANAFAQAYQQRGGSILNTEFYTLNSPTTYLKSVQRLLKESAGTQMAFLAAAPTQARLLRPLLKDQAGLLPVYATSHIFSGRKASADDTDLDGIIYTEIPWVLQNQSGESLGELQYPRLYALGMDAVMIAKSLPRLTQNQSLAGQTGQISISPQHRIQRRLEFATFINGQPESLGN